MRRALISKALRSCSKPSQLHQIHSHMIKTGLDRNPFLASKLLAAAAAGGGGVDIPGDAISIFAAIENPNLFMHNTILRAHSVAPSPDLHQALSFFTSLKARGISLDQFSFIATLKVCARALAFDSGRSIHGSVLRHGFECFLNLRNTLVHFYCSCGWVGDARKVFDEMASEKDAVSWSALMNGYLNLDRHYEVLEFFWQMRSYGMEINDSAIVTALSASADTCCSIESMHGYCVKTGFLLNLKVGTAIVTRYVKSGSMDFGRKVFDEMPDRDVVLYNSLVDGYAKRGDLQESVTLLNNMESERVKPNATTLIAVLLACASSGALIIGRRIHEYVKQEIIYLDISLATALIDMYSKCGSLKEAVEIFNQMPDKDVKLWTAMITGFGVNGRADAALQLFGRMEGERWRPNEVTFLAVLSACSHSGLVEEAKKCLYRMVQEYGIMPTIEHYGCMIDLLGRAGQLEAAFELIKGLPSGGDATAWRALLSASRVYGNFKIGEMAQRYLVELGDEHPTDLILLSSTYALGQRWADVARLRDVKGEKATSKKAGCSSIEMCGKM